MPDPSMTYDGRIVVDANEYERLEAVRDAARVLVDRWRWDLANQPEIAALARALCRGVEMGVKR